MQKQKVRHPPSSCSLLGGLFLHRFICILFNKAHCFTLFVHAIYEQISILKFLVKILNYVNFCKIIIFQILKWFIHLFNLRFQDQLNLNIFEVFYSALYPFWVPIQYSPILETEFHIQLLLNRTIYTGIDRQNISDRQIDRWMI